MPDGIYSRLGQFETSSMIIGYEIKLEGPYTPEEVHLTAVYTECIMIFLKSEFVVSQA